LVEKDGDATVATGLGSQHDYIGVAIAVDVAGECLTALAGQGVVAFEDGYSVGLAEQHHECRTDGRIGSDYGHIQHAIAVDVAGGRRVREHRPVEQGIVRPPAAGVQTP